MNLRWHRSRQPKAGPTPAAALSTSGSHRFLLPQERLPSRIATVHFAVRLDGTWRTREDEPLDHGDPTALARHHFRTQVAQILVHHSVLDLTAAHDAVNATTSRWLHPATGLEITGTVRLAVSARDRKLADEHLRREQRGHLERQETLHRLAFLHPILADHDTRLVWWIDRYPDRVDQLDGLNKTLADLKPPPDPARDTLRDEVGRFVDQLLDDLRTPQQREIFIRALSHALHVLGKSELQTRADQWLPPDPAQKSTSP